MINMGNVGPAIRSPHIQQKLAWQATNLMSETRNAFTNWMLTYISFNPDKLAEYKELLDLVPGRIKCISSMKKGSGPALIIGSGSSLNELMPRIKEWKGAIFCSTSQASTLIHYGIHPTYMIILDPRMCPQDEFAADDWGDTDIIGHVSIPFVAIERWLRRAKGNIYFGRIMEPTYDWYSHHLGQGYSMIRHIMLPMIDSTASEIGFATWLGYGPIFLAGIDYGGPRFDRYEWNYEKKEWIADLVSSKFDMKEHQAGIKAMSYASRGTLLSSLMQIKNEKYKQKIYQLSDRSVLNQFPKVEWNDVLEKQGNIDTSNYPYQEVIDNIEISLSVWETFLIPAQGGWGTDYQTYIAAEIGPLINAIQSYNNSVTNNLRNFTQMEEQTGKPVAQMIQEGITTIEAGDLLLHAPEEFGEWDWHRIKPIDIDAVIARRQWLIDQAKKRGYIKGEVSMVLEPTSIKGKFRCKGCGNEDVNPATICVGLSYDKWALWHNNHGKDCGPVEEVHHG